MLHTFRIGTSAHVSSRRRVYWLFAINKAPETNVAILMSHLISFLPITYGDFIYHLPPHAQQYRTTSYHPPAPCPLCRYQEPPPNLPHPREPWLYKLLSILSRPSLKSTCSQCQPIDLSHHRWRLVGKLRFYARCSSPIQSPRAD
jgi:hypothetical protein